MHGATFNLDTGKTLGWAGATPLLGAFGCPKESWGRSSPANMALLCLRSVLPVSSEGKRTRWRNTRRSSNNATAQNKSHFRRQRMGNCESEEC